MDKMEEKAHALLSASRSQCWLECTPSARAEEKYPDEGSDFANEGTLAHAMAAKKLKERLGLPTFAETAEIRELSEYMTGEMEEYTSEYADFVMERYATAFRNTPMGKVTPEIRIEQRLDFSSWVKEGFGTGDTVIVSHDTIEIIDLKYGKGVKVDATDNPQLKLYALGAMEYYDYAYGVEKVTMTIYQPRVGNISSWECGIKELEEWGYEVLAPIASMAYRGLGSRKSGEWCRFCKAKGECPRLAADSVVDYLVHPDGTELSASELSALLYKLPMIKDWVSAVEERSLDLALSGKEIPGYKVVEGRSIRKIIDAKAVAMALVGIGGTEAEIYKPQELRNLTDLEKTFGKKLFASTCKEWIEKPKGKPTLVPVSDKREEINNNDFKDLEI